jgi:DeoR family transcriptional regulator of aga operon
VTEPRSRGMRRTERMDAILGALTDSGAVHVADLANRFGVSEATLRRDLALLEEQRLLTRTHGGALAQDAVYELPARTRDGDDGRAGRRAIAALAAGRLPEGPHVVALNGGATTTELARRLAGREELTLVTNAVNIAMDLITRPKIKLVVVGGMSRPGSYELVGPWAEEVIAGLGVGTAFVSGDGISADGGLTTDDEQQARTVRALIERAQRVIVLADGPQVGRVALVRVAGIEAIDEVITDGTAAAPALSALRGAGVAIGVADPTPR